jgi:EAL domain-containing protein (putative c-di-GMP-specific phosphodiesterase class I)
MATTAGARRSALKAVYPHEEFRQALVSDQLVVHYQPIIELDTGVVRGAEALLRWDHPSGGLLPPDDFLPAITHTPVMPDVTRWVLTAACATAAGWEHGSVSVNISATDVTRSGLVAEVVRALASSGLAPERLIIELTEHAVVQDVPAAAQVLGALRELGVGVALDDFGTGYSSLFYLRELPISEVKIDRTFTTNLDTSDEDAAIVESIVRLAHAVGITAVAEGVERDAQASVLRSLGCPCAQGYLWGAPDDSAELDVGPRPVTVAVATRRGQRPRRGQQPLTPDSAGPIQEMLLQGASLHTIAAALNRSGVLTAWGSRWSAATVARAVTSL